jgi:hypothetical protein
MMKAIMKRAIRDQRGQAMVLAVILLLVGGLIVSSLLAYMGNGLLNGRVYERRTAELYAADAGVEDAVWRIQNPDEAGYLPCSPSSPPRTYTITDINGKSVEVSIEYVGDGTYRITSIATADGGGGTAAIDSSTTVEAYLSVSYLDFSDLLDNAIVSNSTITVQPGNVINGDVWLPDSGDLTNRGTINGDVKDSNNITITWPTYEQLSPYYLEDVEGAPDPGSSYDINGQTKTEGPWYRNGSLSIDNTGDPATLILGGTIYVTDNLQFQQSGSHEYTIDLNGHTIFGEGAIDFPSAHVSISGSGCIIAVGDITFQPSIVSGPDDFVLVMSIAGLVEFQPSGNFTGCVAGDSHVQLQPGNTINWISPAGKGLDVPWGVGGGNETPVVTGLNIVSWEIK